MEDLQTKHRQEQRDLQSRITQKKKSAIKKTRKRVNDECTSLERQLKEQHELELSALDSGSVSEAPRLRNDYDEILEAVVPKSDELQTVGETDDSSHILQSSEVGQTKKPHRQKARLARRAAEQEAVAAQAAKESSDLPDLREREREAMRLAYTARGLKEREIRSDGHCLYAAIADQIMESDIDLQPSIGVASTNNFNGSAALDYKVVRHVAAKYISDNPDDFVPFLEKPLDEYTQMIRDTGEWGGHLELLALARAYGVNINVLQGDGDVVIIECGSEKTASPLWLAYYHHSFGLGEHYNSLRRAVP